MWLADLLGSVDLVGLAILAWRVWVHHRDEVKHGSQESMDTDR